MAVVGHPFYAGGYDQTMRHEPISSGSSSCFVDRGVTIMMAGDTHDLEYYADRLRHWRTAVHYFVNGGGGAYLSFGTVASVAWQVTDGRMGVLSGSTGASWTSSSTARRGSSGRRWWWTNRFDAWPFSAEWLSGLFDYNVAPFFPELLRSPRRSRQPGGSGCCRTAFTGN